MKHKVASHSGVPLLSQSVEPLKVFEKFRGDLRKFLQSVYATFKEEVSEMREKFIIRKFDIGLNGLNQEISKAKTVGINNATANFVIRANQKGF